MWFKRKKVDMPEWRIMDEREEDKYARKLADFIRARLEVLGPGRVRMLMAGLIWLMIALSIVGMVFSKKRATIPIEWPKEIVLQKPTYPVMRESFHRYVDSLRQNKQFDSLLRARPHLEDTLRFIEELSEIR